MKKTIAILLALVLCLALAACGSSQKSTSADVKIGFIFLHDENSTYDKNFMDAAKETCEKLNVEYLLKTNIPEDERCAEAAEELIDQGCNIIFADSFGHESFMIQVAKEHPDVQFCHATGTRAHTEGLPNYHNAFASIYEGRYLAGVAAGMKIKEMIDKEGLAPENAKIGYIGAYTYAEVISGYTSFFLGARSIVPEVTMEVTFTGSWYDFDLEQTGAKTLIDDGCVLISQHADSMGAPGACETAGIPNVSYNGSTLDACPNTFIVSSRINWSPYFEFIIDAVKNGKEIPADWTGTIETGSVVLTDVNTAVAAEGTAEAIEAVKAELQAGTRHVFDITTFTVEGKTLEEYMADVDTDEAYTGDHNVIHDGFFDESGADFRSAPFFDLRIDGITLLDQKY